MKKVIYLCMLFLFAGCNFLDDYSQDLVVAKTVTDLEEVLLGSCYLPSREAGEINNGFAWWLNVLDDDVNTVIAHSARKGWSTMDGRIFGYTTWQEEVGRNHRGNNLAGDDGVWTTLYQRINAVNIVLSEIDDKDQSGEKDRLTALRVKGECHFLRAQFYLMLVNIYGDAYSPLDAATKLGVPLKLTHYVEHDKDKESQFERVSVETVYQQIIKDLQASVDYFIQSPQTRSFYRASRGAALLLLSRVYLYMQNWTEAKQVAGDFLKIKSDLQALSGMLKDSLTISMTDENPEIVFSQSSLTVQNAFSGVGGDLCISGDLYHLYDALDGRRAVWFARSLQSDSIGLSRKYKTGSHRSYVSDLFMLRSAEGYLNMAEACAMTDDAAGASEWLNKLRDKRIENYTPLAYNLQEAMEQVRLERRKELCIEGHRWFDLRRYAVCQKAPFKKAIERVYALYNYDNKNFFMHAEVYKLEENDPAYTFSIPKSVVEFDMGMPSNIRPERKYLRTIFVDF